MSLQCDNLSGELQDQWSSSFKSLLPVLTAPQMRLVNSPQCVNAPERTLHKVGEDAALQAGAAFLFALVWYCHFDVSPVNYSIY